MQRQQTIILTLDMGKCCIRFKEKDVPMQLIGDLAAKVTVQDWINTYESKVKKQK